MKTLIVYGSRHHGNTEKLVNAIAQRHAVDVLNAEGENGACLEAYDLIGFASGIDFGRFYPSVTDLARRLPAGKQVFALFTCAKDNGKYGNEIQEIAAERDCGYLGKFGCRGFNTYGPWKLIGGMNKAHPSQQELAQALCFYEQVMQAAKTKD